jgi:4-hydroxybenzoate polyprenyltransferase
MNHLLYNKFIAFLKLIRVENLVMMALTEFCLRYLVLNRAFSLANIELELPTELYNLVILSTIFIAAAGYIINDYFDVKTDLINRPDTVVVDRVIKRRWAIILHMLFTFTGLLLGFYTALETGYLRLAIFPFVAAILLWFYSTHFKKQLLTGNIVVSLLTATIALVPFVFEMGMIARMHPEYLNTHTRTFLSVFKILFVFSLFVFITSLAREIIKDMEDYEGDKATGGATLPIVWGLRSSKLISFFLLVITALLLSFVVYNTFKASHDFLNIHILYICFTLIAPLVFLSAYILKATSSAQFKKASLVLKLIMLAGLCYSLVYYYS